jgi:hypothetical protein
MDLKIIIFQVMHTYNSKVRWRGILVPTPKTSKEVATKEDFILSEVKSLLAVCAYFTPRLQNNMLLVGIKYLCIDFTFSSHA